MLFSLFLILKLDERKGHLKVSFFIVLGYDITAPLRGCLLLTNRNSNNFLLLCRAVESLLTVDFFAHIEFNGT